VHADLLVLLSDVDALYTRPPEEPGAQPIAHVPANDALENVEIGDAGLAGVGTGGALTKVSAARLAAEAGTAVLLTSTALVAKALRGESVGTWFEPTATID
jgi:glutamate 5-kinase